MTEKSPTPPTRARRLRQNLLLAAGTFLALFVLAEAATRVFVRVENLGTVIQYDGKLGWALAPKTQRRSVDHKTHLDYMVKINSLGMRDREVTLDKPAGVTRILHMGDSVPFGNGVDARWRYSDFMGRALGDNVEVLNLGVPGWGTDQAVLHFERLGRQLHPDIVILTFTMVNDVVNNALNRVLLGTAEKPRFEVHDGKLELAHRVGPPAAVKRSRLKALARSSRFLVAIKRRIDRQRHANAHATHIPPGFAHGHELSHWSVFERNPDPVVTEAWHTTEALLLRLSRDCNEIGARLVVFAFPLVEADDEWCDELAERAGVDPATLDMKGPFDRLASFCDENRIDFLYPIDEFRAASKKRSLYFEADGHPNEFGHALAARTLLDFVRERYHFDYVISSVDDQHLPVAN